MRSPWRGRLLRPGPGPADQGQQRQPERSASVSVDPISRVRRAGGRPGRHRATRHGVPHAPPDRPGSTRRVRSRTRPPAGWPGSSRWRRGRAAPARCSSDGRRTRPPRPPPAPGAACRRPPSAPSSGSASAPGDDVGDPFVELLLGRAPPGRPGRLGGLVPGGDQGDGRGPLEGGVAGGHGGQVGDQAVAAGEHHVDLGPRLPHGLAGPGQAIEGDDGGDDQRDQQHEDHDQHHHGVPTLAALTTRPDRRPDGRRRAGWAGSAAVETGVTSRSVRVASPGRRHRRSRRGPVRARARRRCTRRGSSGRPR